MLNIKGDKFRFVSFLFSKFLIEYGFDLYEFNFMQSVASSFFLRYIFFVNFVSFSQLLALFTWSHMIISVLLFLKILPDSFKL
ncbi:MAG: hypothetical protein A2W90_19655 [Bacteroidetes bacterium GWF2_42_66]|nr:MAG: hypothetical protein A2W92_17825 [Bacteroidetes bacterium GWA2_42_15]OFX98623.1 MAG: hypothetical protein A2W89_10040 [Bacteroidetes bacterium GWE2_42_39]OFY43180.1 MAG: hypothetical protein A2W90_19655 [Bacteroidetes bacterium GWF2_42_66]HBL76967.1 hypothetical protein [Prolixibacteraceae bacterium]HCR91808.1 hypothetical protein [Prolixibacteraceae bacterium]